MSWPERSVRHHKRQTDCAIRRAYARLAADAPAVAKFDELLYYVRNRAARLLEAPVLSGQHPGVKALVNLSRFGGAHIRPVAEWSGTTSSWHRAVASLARHLVCKYEVPVFLASSWYSTEGAAADKRRAWFVAHAGGASFRSLDLPIVMTRRMERIFLASHDHLTIDPAIRRAELLALGAPAELVQAVVATRLATDLSNGEFWRTVWIFLVANASILDPAQIAPMIDYIQAIRHERTAMETQDGMVELGPPQPDFSMKGRTVQSMLRLMRDWHKSLGLASAGLAWAPSPLQPMLVEEPSPDPSDPPRRWQMLELTNSAQLRTEGTALHHCVASYADHCYRGLSRIWSLRFWRGEKVHHVLTIEIDPRRRAVVQARGWANRVASGKPLRLLQEWANRERVRLAI
jgi:hypothetical protein